MMKKTMSMLLVVAMILSLSVCAFATDGGKTDITTVEIDNGTANVDLKGEITDSPSLISVVIPAAIEFTVVTEEYSGSDKVYEDMTGTTEVSSDKKVFKSFVSASNAAVTNNSTDKAVKVVVTGVSDSQYGLLKKLDMTLAGTETAIKLNSFSTDNDNVISNSIAANGGSCVLKLTGTEGKVKSGAGKIQLPDGNATVTVVLKVSATA